VNKEVLGALEGQLNREIDEQHEEARRLKGVTEVVRTLQHLELDTSITLAGDSRMDARWEQLVTKLVTLEFEFRDEIDKYGLSGVATAAIHPLFSDEMDRWQPLNHPTHLIPHLHRLRNILGIGSRLDGNALSLQNGHHHRQAQSKSTTAYETMIYTLWLPRVRSAITNDWNVHEPSAVISLIEAWKDILPPFVYANVIDQLVVQKLTGAVIDWSPRGGHKEDGIISRRISGFSHGCRTWTKIILIREARLGYLPTSSASFASLSIIGISQEGVRRLGKLEGGTEGELDNVLIRHLLPRLASHMQEKFDINPQGQDLTALEQVLLWRIFQAEHNVSVTRR
jgi:tuftelin-interacting protein 11